MPDSDFDKVVWYEHHGKMVAVRSLYRGHHKQHCLCYLCSKFHPCMSDNCPVAQRVYELDVEFGITTPVWECPEFVRLEGD